MDEVKFIEGVKIYLRPFEDKDADLVYFGKNNTAVRESLFLFEPTTKIHISNELQSLSERKDAVKANSHFTQK